MDERSDQIVEHIERERENLGRNLSNLQDRIKSTTDWRVQFDRHPMAMLGLAMGGGLLLGAMVGSGRHSRSDWRSSSDLSSKSYASGSYASSGSAYTGSSSSQSSGRSLGLLSSDSPGFEHQRSKAMETIDTLKGAFMAWAVSQVRDYVNQMLPGFSHHYEETTKHNQRASSSGSGMSSGSSYSGGAGTTGSTGTQTTSYSTGQRSTHNDPVPAL